MPNALIAVLGKFGASTKSIIPMWTITVVWCYLYRVTTVWRIKFSVCITADKRSETFDLDYHLGEAWWCSFCCKLRILLTEETRFRSYDAYQAKVMSCARGLVEVMAIITGQDDFCTWAVWIKSVGTTTTGALVQVFEALDRVHFIAAAFLRALNLKKLGTLFTLIREYVWLG